VGAALGGLTAAYFGYNAAFIVNSLSFVLSAIFIAPIPGSAMRRVSREAPSAAAQAAALSEGAAIAALQGSEAEVVAQAVTEQSQANFLTDLREGLAYIWRTQFVRGVILVNIGWATGGGMNNLLYDQLGGHTFITGEGDRGDWGVATLFTSVGTGLFIGLTLARRAGAWASQERRAGQFIGWSLIVHGLFFSLAGLMPSLALMAVCLATSRLIIGMEFGVQETMVMRVLPDDYRGRVFTTDRALELAMTTISMIIGGWMLTRFSPRAMMVASGLLSASPGLIWLLALRFKRFSVPERALR
jgi:hypothetical protein